MSELKDYYEINGVPNFIHNAKMYDLKSSLIASGFPMRPHPNYEETDEKLLNRGQRLGAYPIGAGENNYLKGVIISFDITLPVKVWTEWERYTFSPIISSTSTMHKITNFDVESFSEDTDQRMISLWNTLRNEYNENPTKEKYLKLLHSTPTGLKLTARVSCSMMSLRNMYSQRKNHKLKEWRLFCKWLLDEIPYFKKLTAVTEQ